MRVGSGRGVGRLNRAKSCRLGAWAIGTFLSVCLAIASPSFAQNGDARGVIANIFGTLVQGAIADNVRASWLKVDPEILYCLGIVHHISPAQLAAQGVSPSDARLQPYIRDCQVRIANVPPENQERLANQSEQFAAEQAAEIQGQRQQAGQALAGQTIQGGVQAYRQAQQERAAEDQARQAQQQQQAAWDAQQRQQTFAAQEQQQRAQSAAQQRAEWAARQGQQAALSAQQPQAAPQRRRPGFQQSVPAQPYSATSTPPTATPPNPGGRYSFRPTASGTVEVYQDGQRVATTTPEHAAQLGYTPATGARLAANGPSPQSSPPLPPTSTAAASGSTPQSSSVPAPPTANAAVTRDSYTFVQNYDGDALGTVSIYKNGQLVQTAVPQTAAAYGYRGGELDSYQTSDGSAARNVASTETSRASISTMPTTTGELPAVTVSSSAGASSGAAYAASRPPSPPPQTGPIYPGAPGSPTYNAALAHPSYTFTANSSGLVEVYQNGHPILTTSPANAAQRYGYVPGANSGGQPNSSSPTQTPTPAGQQTYVTPNGAVVTATGQVVKPAGSASPNQPTLPSAAAPQPRANPPGGMPAPSSPLADDSAWLAKLPEQYRQQVLAIPPAQVIAMKQAGTWHQYQLLMDQAVGAEGAATAAKEFADQYNSSVHSNLANASLIPGPVGQAAAATNAIVYAGQGQKANAVVAAVGAIPDAGAESKALADANVAKSLAQDADRAAATDASRIVPQNATDTLKYINETGHAPPGYIGGRLFRNTEGHLPANGNYREYDVNPSSAAGASRNAERIVVDTVSGRAWYTDDHYLTFIEIVK